jgi:hypothetical protein
MTERFEQEFYTSAWRRVLPLGPYGIQPYVRPARRRRGAVGLPRLGASIGRTLERITKFGGWAAVGVSKRPMPEGVSPPRHAPPGGGLGKHPGRAAPQPLRKAA